MKRIHWSKIWEVMQEVDEHGNPKPFQLTFVKISTGEVVSVPSCTLTSIHSKGSTLKTLYDGADHPRTIKKCLITVFNGKKVYL